MSPKGYLKARTRISAEQADRIQKAWEDATRNNHVPVLSSDVEFVRLDDITPLDPSIIPCGHCGQWAAVQTECKHCGARVF